jgi:hypothetical protein
MFYYCIATWRNHLGKRLRIENWFKVFSDWWRLKVLSDHFNILSRRLTFTVGFAHWLLKNTTGSATPTRSRTFISSKQEKKKKKLFSNVGFVRGLVWQQHQQLSFILALLFLV